MPRDVPMKIISHPRCKFLPCVPDLLVRDSGDLIDKKGQVSALSLPQSEIVPLESPIELQGGQWIAFMENGDPIVLDSEQEPKWRADTAVRLLAVLQQPVDPGAADALPKFLERTNYLLAATNLVGLNFHSLLQKIAAERKTPEETLESVLKRVIANNK